MIMGYDKAFLQLLGRLDHRGYETGGYVPFNVTVK